MIDPRRTTSCDGAALHLALAPGSDVALFNGLLSEIARRGHTDDGLLANVEGADAAFAAAAQADRSVTGLDPAERTAFYDLWCATEKVGTVYSQGVNQSTTRTDKVNAILNCHLATGRIGGPGRRPYSVTGQPNAMGGREVGGLANMLACHLDLENAAHRAAVGGFWGTSRLPQAPGLKAVDMFRAVADGKIKALWIIHTNPAVSMPDADRVRDAIADCDFVVVSDITAATDTARLADVLLRATAWGSRFFAGGHFFIGSGKAQMLPLTHRPPAAATSPARPFRRNTGRPRDHWHTMTRTAKCPRLSAHLPEPFLEIHPDDAARLSLSPAGLGEVTSDHGRSILRAKITRNVRPGDVFAPTHWTGDAAPRARIDALGAPETDPISGQPESKAATVAAAPFAAEWYGFAVPRAAPCGGLLGAGAHRTGLTGRACRPHGAHRLGGAGQVDVCPSRGRGAAVRRPRARHPPDRAVRRRPPRRRAVRLARARRADARLSRDTPGRPRARPAVGPRPVRPSRPGAGDLLLFRGRREHDRCGHRNPGPHPGRRGRHRAPGRHELRLLPRRTRRDPGRARGIASGRVGAISTHLDRFQRPARTGDRPRAGCKRPPARTAFWLGRDHRMRWRFGCGGLETPEICHAEIGRPPQHETRCQTVAAGPPPVSCTRPVPPVTATDRDVRSPIRRRRPGPLRGFCERTAR